MRAGVTKVEVWDDGVAGGMEAAPCGTCPRACEPRHAAVPRPPRFDRCAIADAHYSSRAQAKLVQEQRLFAHVPLRMMAASYPAGYFADPAKSEISLKLVTAGTGRYRVDLGSRIVSGRYSPGAMILAPSEADSSCETDAPSRLLKINLALSWLRWALEPEDNGWSVTDLGAPQSGMWRDPAVELLAARLWATDTETRAGQLFLESGALALATLLVTRFGPGRDAGSARRQALSPRQLRAVEQLMLERLSENLSLKDLAGAAGLSPWHFSRAFKATTGESPHRALMNLRIREAQVLLAGSRASVTEIAHATGFASSQHLATLFRRRVGTTPSAYRQEVSA